MRLDTLCDVRWTYDVMESFDPADRQEGMLFGQGTAAFRGRLAGTATWANNPRLRGEHAFPDARGVLRPDSGGLVMFSVSGVASLTDGRAVHVLRFTTREESLLWLNTAVAVGEGSVDVSAGVLEVRYYECVGEPLGT